MVGKLTRLLSVSLALVVGWQDVARGGPWSCCERSCCPPPLYHCMEGRPRIRFKSGCPKPTCCPCENANWGYFQPCWVPWPWPPDWSHCPVPPPAATVIPGPGGPVPNAHAPGHLPAPRFELPGL